MDKSSSWIWTVSEWKSDFVMILEVIDANAVMFIGLQTKKRDVFWRINKQATIYINDYII